MIQKTKVLTLIVFGLLFINLSAQEDNFNNDPNAKLPDEDRKFRFGLQFSPNLSWLKANTTGYDGDGAKFGFSYGLSFEYFMSKNYLFSTGFSILNSKGGLNYKGIVSVNGVNYQAEAEESFNLKYVEIPLLLKLRTNEIGYLTYFGQIGFKTGFNFSAKSAYSYSGIGTMASGLTINPTPIYQDEGEYSSAEINWINMYLVLGAGVEYSISGNTSIILGLTFNNGFINQLDSKTLVEDVNGDAAFDTAGNPIYSNKDASANLNYFALNIGIYF